MARVMVSKTIGRGSSPRGPAILRRCGSVIKRHPGTMEIPSLILGGGLFTMRKGAVAQLGVARHLHCRGRRFEPDQLHFTYLTVYHHS